MRSLIAAVLVLTVCAPVSFARQWTDSTGKFTIEAEFVEFKDGEVRLKKASGSIITIPVEKLSEADQKFVREVKSQQLGKGVKKGPPKEFAVDLGNGVKLEMVLIPAGEFLMGSPDSDKDAVHEREAAAPGSDHEALLPGQVSGDAGAVGGRDGQQPKPLQGSEEPGGTGQLGRLPAVSREAQREDRAQGGKFAVAHRGAVGICLPGGEHDAVLLRGR